MAEAARVVSTPASFALISSATCTSGPPVGAPLADGGVLFPLRVAAPLASEAEAQPLTLSDGEGLTVFPDAAFPGGSFTQVSPGVAPPLTIAPPTVTLPGGEPPQGQPLTPPTPPGESPRPTTPLTPLPEPLPIRPPTVPQTLIPAGPFRPPVVTQPPIPGVPEPATWAFLILGFGLIGARLRRRPGSGEGARPGDAPALTD